MNSYETYLKMNYILQIEDAMEIYNGMLETLSLCKVEGKADIVHELVRSSCYYTEVRMSWEFKTNAEKVADDPNRTLAHNAVIRNVDIVARMINNAGIETPWRDKLGNDRKRIGDFGCFIGWITAINNRLG